jgi:predicted O-methyltransferase YrrM
MLNALKERLWPRRRGLERPTDPGWHDNLSRDEYVEHIIRIIGGWLDPGNVRSFDYCLKHMPRGGAALEIGSFLGLSTCVLAYGILRLRPGTRLVTCDSFLFAGRDKPKGGYFDTGSVEYREWVMDGLRKALTLFCKGNEPYVIEASSADFLAWWREGRQAQDMLGRTIALGGPLSFAYIDGDHTYAGVKGDLEALTPLLLPGGLVLFDDSADSSEYAGIRKLMGELLSDPGYELVMRDPNYCFARRG